MLIQCKVSKYHDPVYRTIYSFIQLDWNWPTNHGLVTGTNPDQTFEEIQLVKSIFIHVSKYNKLHKRTVLLNSTIKLDISLHYFK